MSGDALFEEDGPADVSSMLSQSVDSNEKETFTWTELTSDPRPRSELMCPDWITIHGTAGCVVCDVVG